MGTLIAVLGMHRSGTSAVAGTLQGHGVELGPASESNPYNRRGNREITKLRKLHERILARSGGSWWDPPAAVEVTDRHRAKRNDILAQIPGKLRAVKDPRMLVLLDFWRDVDSVPLGVIRNPVAVRDSLLRRAEQWGKPILPAERWEALWRHYNSLLLAELEARPFPVIDFDRPTALDAQVRAALAELGIAPSPAPEPSFFDPELVSEGAGEDWRSEVLDAESVGLWERLARHAVRGA